MPSVDMLIKTENCFSVSTDYLSGLDDKKRHDVSELTA